MGALKLSMFGLMDHVKSLDGLDFKDSIVSLKDHL